MSDSDSIASVFVASFSAAETFGNSKKKLPAKSSKRRRSHQDLDDSDDSDATVDFIPPATEEVQQTLASNYNCTTTGTDTDDSDEHKNLTPTPTPKDEHEANCVVCLRLASNCSATDTDTETDTGTDDSDESEGSDDETGGELADAEVQPVVESVAKHDGSAPSTGPAA